MAWLQKNISEIATLISGIPFRARVENDPEGRIAVIQARDLLETGQVEIETSAKVRLLPGSTKASLHAGDVVIQPRGVRFPVGLLMDQPMPVAAAAPLLVLRCDPRQIDAEFLVLFLKLPGTQKVLRNAAVGTYIPQVPRSVVARLPVDLPDLATQRKLVEFDRSKRLEVELLAQLMAKRERLLELAVRELAKRDRCLAAR